MEILKQGSSLLKPRIAWWEKKELFCDRCNCKFRLERKDEPRPPAEFEAERFANQSWNEPIYWPVVEYGWVRCPNCDKKIRIESEPYQEATKIKAGQSPQEESP